MGERPVRDHPEEDDPLPDEREVIADRLDDLDELDDEEYLTGEEIAADLGIELE